MPPSVQITLLATTLKYGMVRASAVRRGMYIQESSGSPHLSLEPVWPTSSWNLTGDVWFSNGTGSARGLYYADYSSSLFTGSLASGTILPYKVFATTSSLNEINGGTW